MGLADIFQLLDVLAKRNDRLSLENIAKVSFDAIRGLSLFTHENLQVKVGFEDYNVKFKRLGRVLAFLKVTGRQDGLNYINLECGSRVVIRWLEQV